MLNLIIGGGIVGLLAAYYNDDYLLISKDIGGQMSENVLGPRILEVNEYSKKLLKEFNIKENIKTATIGYEVDGLLVSKVKKEDRINYYMKSRCIDNFDDVPSSVMSDGKNKIYYYDLNWNKLITEIKNKIKDRIIYHDVKKIDISHKILQLDNNDTIIYSKLISTIPAPLFYKLSNIKNDSFNYINKYFMITTTQVFDIKNYDYVYFTSNKNSYHRITKLKNNKYCIEYTTNGDADFSLIDKSDECYFIKYGQLVSGKVDKFDDIRFLGRFAEWNHHIKVDDVVGKLINKF